MSVSTETMKELLEKEGTPPKYRNRYLWLGEHLLKWRFNHQLGAWDMGRRFLPANVALRMLRTYEGIEAVINAMHDHGWRMSLETFQSWKMRESYRGLGYRVKFSDQVSSGGVALSESLIDAVLLAAWRAHRRLVNAEKLEGRS